MTFRSNSLLIIGFEDNNSNWWICQCSCIFGASLAADREAFQTCIGSQRTSRRFTRKQFPDFSATKVQRSNV